MKKSLSTVSLAVCLLLPSFLHAAAVPAIDPQALAELKRMSTALGAAPALTYRSRSVVEVPAATGQFVTLFSHAEIALKRPNQLTAQLRGEAPNFDFYYDGSTVTAFAPATKVYSQLKAPATIDKMLPELEAETGIRFVTAPLLYSDPYSVLTRALTHGVIVGMSQVNGIDCVHLAFRRPGVNWEIWIESGTRALPRRLAVTFTDRPNFPRTLVEFSHWNLRPQLSDRRFVFRKPDGATEIPFASVLQPARR